MAIITVEEYKAIAGIKGDDLDAQIRALIPEIEADFLLIRNKPFDGTEEAPEYPTGSKMTAAEMISFKIQSIDGNVGTSSEAEGKYSHSYDFRKSYGYPTYIFKKIERLWKQKN